MQLARIALLGVLAAAFGCGGGEQAGGLDPAPTQPGTAAVTVTGLPIDGSAVVTLTGPAGFTRSVTGSEVITGLAPGGYVLTATDAVVEGDDYLAAPTSQSLTIRSAGTTNLNVSYTIATGRISLSVGGVPAGAAAVQLRKPDGTMVTATGSGLIKGLMPGTYVIKGAEVIVDGDRFAAADSLLILVTPGTAPSPAAIDYQLASGRVELTVTDVPVGGSPSLVLAGPNGFSATATGSGPVKGLPPGQYLLQGPDITADGDLYEALATPNTIQVSAGPAPVPAAVRYRIRTGALAVTIAGLPGGTAANVTVVGPAGFTQVLTASATLRGLVPGSYSISGASVASGAGLLVAQPQNQTVIVTAGKDPVARTVTYSLGVGSVAVTVSGLPGGTAAAITVTGPNGFSAAVTGTSTLAGLTPGSYTLIAAAVNGTGGQVHQPSPLSQTVAVAINQVVPATVTYAPTLGSLAITVAGLPGGVPAAVTVTGPSGFNRAVTGTTTLTGLVPGSYTITSVAVSSGGQSYTPVPNSQIASVTVGGTAGATVSYAGTLGGLAITVGGLPGGVLASIAVTGPAGFNQTVTATQSLTGLASGTYTLAAANVSSGGILYRPTPTSQTAAVTAGSTISKTVTYAATGSLTVTVSGLPGGASAAVTVTGPGGFNQSLTGTQTLTGLTAGTYTVAASNVSSGGNSYAPTPTSQTASVTAGATASRSVAYAASTGGLTVTITGLPGGALAAVTVSGPGGYNQSVTATTTLTALAPGSYTVTAGTVSSGGTYQPTPTTQNATVSNGSTASAAVSYALGAGATLDLSIDGMYLTQAIAKYDGTTPVIAGRDAILRVFVKANQANTSTPSVRVRVYSGAALIQTYTISAPGASVPTAITEGTYASSWNLAIPAAQVATNLRILADVDPTNAVSEADDGNNVFPTNGTPFALDVRTVPTWNVRLIPVLQQVNGLQGNVTAGNLASFLVDPLKLLPVGAYSADLRAVYTTTAPVLQSSNGNGAWGTILSEVLALKSTDGSNRYYYGVVKTTYGSGVAGIGYVGGGANASIGWDNLPSGSGVMAHEVGHNMARPHAPCGGPASPDPGYPYAGGVIGVYGLDPVTLAVKAPTGIYDFMSYCNPAWVSDYNWGRMITYREGGAQNAPPAPSSAVAGLLVWGRITGAGVVVEPAFRLPAPASPPTGSGAYRVEGLAADGRLLFSYPITPVATSDEAGAEHHFAAVVPLDASADTAVARIRVVTPAGPATRASVQSLGTGGRLFLRDPAASVGRPNAVQARFTWDGATYPMAMIRDGATGQVISFARGGVATIWTRSGRFDVTFSDGVRSVTRVVQ